MGLTPGCLSTIRRQAVKAERLAGSTRDAANLLATAEKASQRVSEASWKAVHKFFQEATSSPEGPAALSIHRMVGHMRIPSILSNKAGWKGRGENQMEILKLKALADEEKDASQTRCL